MFLYDKRDDFPFKVQNYPHLDSNVPCMPIYGLYISQLLRFFNWWKDLLFLTFMTNVINKIHKDKWSERMKQFYSNTFRRITPSSVGRLIELNVEASQFRSRL